MQQKYFCREVLYERTLKGDDITNHLTEETERLDEAAKAHAQTAVEAAGEMKALNVALLDVRERTAMTDYLVICSGTSDTHLKSITENIQDAMREQWDMRAKPQGGAESMWLVLDYGDVIVHIFDEQTREFYDLERLWTNPRTASAGA